MKLSSHGFKLSGFFIYICITLTGLLFHEIWRDEWQAILLARGLSFAGLVGQLKYEGHPLLWYLIIKGLYSIYPSHLSVQIFHWLVSVLISWLILFRFRLPPLYALLIIFGYFFIYEYTVIARNYNLVVLFSLLFINTLKERRPVLLLFIYCAGMALTNVYGLLLSGAFTVYLVWKKYKDEPPVAGNTLTLLLVLQCILVFYYVAFLLPPEDNCFTNPGNWSIFNLVRKIPKGGASIFDAFFPLNTGKEVIWGRNFIDQFLIAFLDSTSLSAKEIEIAGFLLKSVLLLPLLFFIIRFFRRQLSVLVFLLSGFLLIYSFQVVIHGGALRYSGFYFIMLLLAYLLLSDEKRERAGWLTGILCIHVFSGLIMLTADLKRPFTNAPALVAYIKENYYSEVSLLLNKPYLSSSVAGYYGEPVHVIGEENPVTFTSWDNCEGLKEENQTFSRLVEKASILEEKMKRPVLIIFNYPPEDRLDPSDDLYKKLMQSEKIRFTGALSGENFYIYQLNSNY